MLELQNICYRVSTPEGELDILRDISITIPDQRLMVFTGPNGGGKTTLAKIIMGLVQPTSGRILYNGQDVTPLSITDRARLGISYGFQQPPRFKGITVHDLSGGRSEQAALDGRRNRRSDRYRKKARRSQCRGKRRAAKRAGRGNGGCSYVLQ